MGNVYFAAGLIVESIADAEKFRVVSPTLNWVDMNTIQQYGPTFKHQLADEVRAIVMEGYHPNDYFIIQGCQGEVLTAAIRHYKPSILERNRNGKSRRSSKIQNK